VAGFANAIMGEVDGLGLALCVEFCPDPQELGYIPPPRGEGNATEPPFLLKTIKDLPRL